MIAVGVAVRNLEQASQVFVTLVNATVGDAIEVERYAMRYRLGRISAIEIELIEVVADTGAIADFPTKQGAGLHHIAFAVDDITEPMAILALILLVVS